MNTHTQVHEQVNEPVAAPANEIKETIQNYVRGYLGAESAMVASAFYPETRLYSVDEQGALEATPLADFLGSLDARKLKGDLREAEVRITDIAAQGPAARAQVSIKLKKVSFTDYLSLLKIEGRWRIVGKVYAAEAL